jgi:hypothetical protein
VPRSAWPRCTKPSGKPNAGKFECDRFQAGFVERHEAFRLDRPIKLLFLSSFIVFVPLHLKVKMSFYTVAGVSNQLKITMMPHDPFHNYQSYALLVCVSWHGEKVTNR